MQCDGVEQCGSFKSLVRRRAKAIEALKRKQAFIVGLDEEIKSHVCAASNAHARPIPNVDIATFGPFNYRDLVEGIYGDKFSLDFPIQNLQSEIALALDRLQPIDRFVLEARMRGVTLKRVSEMVGWKGPERARQVEARAFRRLRHPSRSRALSARIKAYET